MKQEFEKQDELKRSAMRAVAALITIPESGEWVEPYKTQHSLPPSLSLSLPPSPCLSLSPSLTDKSPQLTEFVAQIKANADTAQLFESVQADSTTLLSAAVSHSKSIVEPMDSS